MTKASFKIEKLASLAPMAGATDSAFRQICREHGASFCTSEMVSAKALTMGDKKTPKLMEYIPCERPFGIQLFGYDPETFAQAAEYVAREYAPDFIDINMGCPTPKITTNGSGSALMQTPKTAAAIVKAVCAAVKVPVSVKIRAGYHDTTAPQFAPLLERAGAAWITVHGRTRDRMYRPPVDLDVIRDVKQAVSIPVVGNGDIFSPQDALQMLDYTACDAVMVGRGALGNPFIFAQLNAAILGIPLPPPPSVRQRMETLRRHIQLMCAYKGEGIALREARKHAAWYTKGMRGASVVRAHSSSLHTLDDLDQFIAMILNYAD